MSIVDNIECNDPAQIFGRIKGDLLIGDGAEIDGSVIAQDHLLPREGHHPRRPVKLQDGGSV
jgi:hypothetical protein